MPQLGLFASTSSATPSTLFSSTAPLGFPLRLKITSASLGFTDNLLKTEDTSDSVKYDGSHSYLRFGKTNVYNFGEISINAGSNFSYYQNWTAGATSVPRTGWENGFIVSEATPASVAITASTPQTFTYNSAIPTIAFTNDQGLASNLFSFNPVISLPAGTRSTTLSLNDNADYIATNSPSISYTINKKDVTIALTSQSSTYSTNQSYDAITPVAITSLSGGDTISASFASLLTGMPTTGANAGTYTLSLNPSYTSTNYNITNSPASVTWTISQANQTITFNPTLSGTNGQTQALSASSTSGLSVAFSVVSGPATLAGSTLTYTGTGNVVVRASQAGNTNYNPATNVDKTIVVSASAGAGLSASSTGNLRITFADQTNGLGTKYSNTLWSDYLGDGNENQLQWTGTIWRLRRIESGDTTGIDYPFLAEATNNTSTSATIPTTGWVYTIGSGLAITITPA